jgi:CheY-like chemotaxis protein
MVDDNRDECRNMSDILTDRGYRVDTAHEGRAALRLAEQHAYDLALLDLRMPGMDGLTLCQEVTRLRPATVALLITGYPAEVEPTEARAVGIRKVFAKPVDVPRLLGTIDEVFLPEPGANGKRRAPKALNEARSIPEGHP